MNASRHLITLVVCVLLGGCATQPDFESVEKMVNEDEYLDSLRLLYLEQAKQELAENDLNDSHYFYQKAVEAAKGHAPKPQSVSERSMPENQRKKLESAYAKLVELLRHISKPELKLLIGQAQVNYDCWIQEQEEGYQPQDITRCREGFNQSATEITRLLNTGRELFVVLPHEDGTVGSIEISSGEHRVVLNDANEALSTENPEFTTYTMNQEELEERFSDVIDAKPPKPISYSLFFSTGAATLPPNAQNILEEILQQLHKRDSSELEIVGHADTVGTNQSNQALGEKRARAVLAALKAFKPPLGEVVLLSMGELAPVINSGDEQDEPQNRRVDITIR